MNKYFVSLFALVVLIGFITPIKQTTTEYQPIIDGDGVYWGNQLPPFGEICAPATVHGGPDLDIYKVIETLPVGTKVEMHELGRLDSSWVMIAPARWVQMKNICNW